MTKVSVLGMACRLPGADNYHSFWANLRDGKSQTREIPPDRWDTSLYYAADPAKEGASTSKWAGLLDRVDVFDHRFFKISAREARAMDPQQRLLLEETWHCLEDAGIPQAELQTRVTAVYAAAMTIDYHQNVTAPGVAPDNYSCIGNYTCLLANRLSHVFGWRGESIALDAACSGSLTALHLARQALLAGECDYAIVAAVSLIINPWHYISFGKSRMLSADGTCRAFDRDANGYVPGEGVAVLLLSRDEDARQQGRRVHGRIIGSATGHAGISDTITAPKIAAQYGVIEKAAVSAGIGLETVSYVEAHGTGTALGDPIEIAALTEAFLACGKRKSPCVTGSLKPAIGHLEAAAGLASVIKVLLMMRHRTIVPTLNLANVNPLIDFESGVLRPALQCEAWTALPLRAGVSAFGFGGTNAHIIMEAEEYGPEKVPPLQDIPLPFMLSAASQESFQALWLAWRSFVRSDAFNAIPLSDILGTLAVGRAALAYRFAAIIDGKADLASLFEGELPAPCYVPHPPRILITLAGDQNAAGHDLEYIRKLNIHPLAIVWECSEKSKRQQANFPSVPVYDPLTGQVTLPFAIDAIYLEDLRDRLVIPAECEFAKLVDCSRHLAKAHFTYRSYLADWGRVPGANGNLLDWLEEPPATRRERQVFTLALVVSQRKLREKWHLPEPSDLMDGGWNEAARMVTADLLLESEAITLLDATPAAMASLAKLAAARALVADSLPPLPLLAWHSAERIGGVKVDAPSFDATLRIDGGSLTIQLMKLWLAGARLEWSALGITHHVAELPLYPFEKHRHWIERPDMTGSTQAVVVPQPAPATALQAEMPAALDRLDAYAAHCLFVALERSGALTPLGTGMARRDMIRRCLHSQKHEALLDTTIMMLSRHGLVEIEGSCIRALTERHAAASVASALRPAIERDGKENIALADSIERCIAFLPGIFAGSPSAKDAVFPSGDINLLERLFFGHSVAQPSLIQVMRAVMEAAACCTAESEPGPVQAEAGLGDLLTIIRQAVATSIGSDPASIGLDTRFSDMGLDSLASGDVALRLGQALGCGVSHHVIDDHPTVTRLARYLTELRQEKRVAPEPELGADEEASPRAETVKNSGFPDAAMVPAIDLLSLVRAAVAEVAGAESADFASDARFSDIGIDSLASGDLARVLGSALGLTVSLHAIDDHPTIAKLAAYLERLTASNGSVSGIPEVTATAFLPNTNVWQIAQPGDLGSLTPRPTPRRAPGPGEVEVEVAAAGLNFRDVMEGLGRLGSEPRPLGLEFSGRITALGPGVTSYASGAAVMGLSAACFAGHVTARAELIALKPPGLSFPQAASLPVVFLTAAWCLERIARLERGQSVLIHAATGGVGLAALQFARLAGAEVYTTAGSPEKRAYLQSLGVACIGDSRNVSFASAVRAASGGAGVDVVLNCLAGPMTDASLDLVKPGGVFIELGKTDIRDETEIARLYPGIRYAVFDLLTEIDLDPSAIGSYLARLTRRFALGELTALPLHGFAFSEAGKALVFLARAKHIGKVVLTGAAAAVEAVCLDESAPSAAPALQEASVPADAIAIIGMSGRFPGAPDLTAFWNLLREGRDAIGTVPDGRWEAAEFGGGLTGEALASLSSGGFLTEADYFDAAFFGISPREALLMDPQQRLLLEEAWLAMADAGLVTGKGCAAGADSLVRPGLRMGVYIGASASDYAQKLSAYGVPPDRPSLLAQMPSSAAARLGYIFDVRGPCLTIDMGCASALAAMKLAVDALRRGEIDAALVGAVSVQCTPQLALMANQAEILSSDGRCRSFAADSQGLGLSEGAAIVVLKRLENAMAAGGTIHAVIRAVTISQNGATNSMSSPSVAAQIAVAQAAFEETGLVPDHISYVEGHGVGTRAGDAAELAALTDIFGKSRKLPLGSVKSNIGHSLAAAGMAGLFKVVLQLRHGMIAPTLHAAAPLPGMAETGFSAVERLTPWPSKAAAPRRAAINAFAINGANGFMLIEEAPACVEPRAVVPSGGVLLLIGAVTEDLLRARLNALAARLADGLVEFGSVAARVNSELANASLPALTWRTAFVAADSGELRRSVTDALSDARFRPVQPREAATQSLFATIAARLLAEAEAADRSLRRAKLLAAGELFVCGIDFELPPLEVGGASFPSPARTFQRQRFWPVNALSPAQGSGGAPCNTALPPVADSRFDMLRREAAQVLRMPVSTLRESSVMARFGLDSLLAMELRGRLARLSGAAPDLALLLGSLPLGEIAALLPAAAAPTDTPASIPISPDARFEPFPLTDLQLAYWLGRQADYPLNSACHVYWEFSGPPDRDLAGLEEALNRLIEHHDMLRAVIGADGQQRVLAKVPRYRIERFEWSREESGLAALRQEMARETYDLTRWPLFRVAFSRDANATRLHLGIDLHIIDVSGLAVLIGQWGRLERNLEQALSVPRLSFRDYVLYQKELEKGSAYASARSYWTGLLPRLPAAPRLPGIKPLDSHKPSPWPWTRHRDTLSIEEWRAFKTTAQAAGITPFAALLTAFAEVLAHWAEEPRFTLNVTVNRREGHDPDVTQVIGDFTSTILLGLDLAEPLAFTLRARAAKHDLTRHLDHANFSGVKVLQLRGLRGEAALMPVVFTSMLGHASLSNSIGPLEFGATRTPQVWLDIQVMEDHGGLAVSFDAIDALFPDGLIRAIFAAWGAALRHLARDAAAWEQPLRSWVAAEERARREERNATLQETAGELLHEPFLRQALAAPDRVAIIEAGRHITYGALLGQVLAVARELGEVQPGTLIAVGLPKGWLQIAAVLGILLSGGAYLPIDPGLPILRRRHLLERGAASVVLTLGTHSHDWPPDVTVINVDGLTPSGLPGGIPARRVGIEDLAYVIFTSGSTGDPKGVMIEHGAALNTVLDINARFDVGADDRVLGLSPLGFDLSVYDIFGLLGAGGAIVLPDPRATNDPAHLAQLVQNHGVTIWNSVPAFVELFLRDQGSGNALSSLRLAMLSGDWIPLDLPSRLRQASPSLEIVSLGGATEASIWSIAFPIRTPDPTWNSIPYGYPLRNQSFHVLDTKMQDCPDWVAGELYISGAGLARGYWRDSAATDARFVNHPVTHERLYRTGDLGRYRDGALIEFLGRLDDQVKIGGFRIELGEVEAALLRHPSVSQAAVVACPEPGGRKTLAAFYISAKGATNDPSDLRAHVAAHLPGYMVPASFRRLQAFPLNTNEKIDRKTLASIGHSGEIPGALACLAEPPPSALLLKDNSPRIAQDGLGLEALETRILSIWREILNNPLLSADGKLFENGAHSFHAVDANTRINRALGIGCTVTDIFEFATVRELARALVARRKGANPEKAIAAAAVTLLEPEAAPSRGQRRRQFRALTSI